MGVVLYVLVCGVLPFDERTLHHLRDKVVRGRFRIPYFMSTECESLIRKMLVVDPKKRFTIAMIKRHVWVLMLSTNKLKNTQSLLNPSTILSKFNSQVNVYDEHVLKLMQNLGIDQKKIRESLRFDTYDHYSAIYYLLLEKYHSKTHQYSFDDKYLTPPLPSLSPLLKPSLTPDNFLEKLAHSEREIQNTRNDIDRLKLALKMSTVSQDRYLNELSASLQPRKSFVNIHSKQLSGGSSTDEGVEVDIDDWPKPVTSAKFFQGPSLRWSTTNSSDSTYLSDDLSLSSNSLADFLGDDTDEKKSELIFFKFLI